MNVQTALKDYDTRIQNGNKWLLWDSRRLEWLVCQRPYNETKLNKCLYEGKSFRKALTILVS